MIFSKKKDLLNDIGIILKKKRVEKSMSLREQAKVFKISQGYISEMTYGKRNYQFDFIKQIFKVYQKDLYEDEADKILASFFGDIYVRYSGLNKDSSKSLIISNFVYITFGIGFIGK